MEMKSLNSLTPGKWVIFVCPSGYVHYPYRFMEGRLVSRDWGDDYENVAGDYLSDYGEPPIGYFEIPEIKDQK